MSKKVLVTGGAGFVGSHTVDALLQLGHEVTIFDNLTDQVHRTGEPDYLPSDARLIRGDIRDLGAVQEAIQGIDVVYHLAAAVGVGQSMYEIARYMEINTQGTANLLQAMLKTKGQVQKLIVASSMSIYGEGQYQCKEHGSVAPSPRWLNQLREKQWEIMCSQCGTSLTPMPTSEEKPLQCTSIYALGKKNQEEMCLLFGRTYGIPVVALRYFNIYGTRQALSNPYTGVAAIFASRLMNNRAPLIFEDGHQQRDFVSVDDVVRANLLAMDRGDGLALNIGSGHPITIQEVAEAISNALRVSVPAELTGKYRAGDIRHCFADISKAQAVLGYVPKNSFREGIGQLVEWVRSQAAVDHVQEMTQQLVAYGLTA